MESSFNPSISRRQVLKGAGVVTATSTLSALGFGSLEAALAQTVRPFKIGRARETRCNCTFCSVS